MHSSTLLLSVNLQVPTARRLLSAALLIKSARLPLLTPHPPLPARRCRCGGQACGTNTAAAAAAARHAPPCGVTQLELNAGPRRSCGWQAGGKGPLIPLGEREQHAYSLGVRCSASSSRFCIFWGLCHCGILQCLLRGEQVLCACLIVTLLL